MGSLARLHHHRAQMGTGNALGPWLVTADEVPNPGSMTKVVTRQQCRDAAPFCRQQEPRLRLGNDFG